MTDYEKFIASYSAWYNGVSDKFGAYVIDELENIASQTVYSLECIAFNFSEMRKIYNSDIEALYMLKTKHGLIKLDDEEYVIPMESKLMIDLVEHAKALISEQLKLPKEEKNNKTMC